MIMIRLLDRTIPALVSLAALVAAPAFAQTGRPDGSPPPAYRALQAETVARFTCGPLEYSKLVTDRQERTTTSRTFTTVPNASVAITRVPAGQTRCVKVVFSAETACSATAAGDYCYVRALDNAAVMQPDGGGFHAFDSDHATAQSHSFEWVRLVGPGDHIFRIQWRVRDNPTSFFIDEFTMDVQVYNMPLGDGG